MQPKLRYLQQEIRKGQKECDELNPIALRQVYSDNDKAQELPTWSNGANTLPPLPCAIEHAASRKRDEYGCVSYQC